MPCSPGGSPVPSEPRLAAVVLGKPAVIDSVGQTREKRRDVGASTEQFGTHPVDQQHRNPSHTVQTEPESVLLAVDVERTEYRRDEVGEGAVAVAGNDQHAVRLSSGALPAVDAPVEKFFARDVEFAESSSTYQ